MAKVKGNLLAEGLSGKLGGVLVFQENGIVRTRPDMSKVKWSEAQLEHRRRFARARQFAKAVTANPETKAYYQAKAKKGIGAYQVAISEYLKDPHHRDKMTNHPETDLEKS
ncbi:MAG: hypothetical protein IH596_11555 [Bacteroidales bacterium]|nr:hypothetical protein [Bacteroidales bacterium]